MEICRRTHWFLEAKAVCRTTLRKSFGILWSWVLVPSAFSDQPIFNEMPRWDHGWGVQFVQELRREDDLLSGGDVVASGFSEEVDILHAEGVYTWDRSIRMTVKLPIVTDASRELPDGLGGKLTQKDDGIGDATLALPLKKYFNLDGRSGSWTLAPQVRVPLSGDDEYEVYDGAWGGGLSVGCETETYDYLFAVGLSAWTFESGEPFKTSAHVDVGRNFRIFRTSGHVKWETDFIYEDDGLEKLLIGPHVYLRINDILHAQVMYKKEVHSRRNALDHGNGELVRLGVAFVY